MRYEVASGIGLLGSLLFGSSFAMGQGGGPPATLATNCNGAHFSANKLEDNQDILTAARNGLATQLVTNFDSTNPTKIPDIHDFFRPTNLKAVAAADCLLQVSPATAQAVTSQTNKQIGATPSSDGTTSATEKTGISQLLGVAVENGAVTNDVTGNTMTLSTSVYGLATGAAYVILGGRIQDTQHEYASCSFCVKTGASATFNITNTSDPLASATRKQVSQWQLKYSFLDKSIRSERVAGLYNTEMGVSYGLTDILSVPGLAMLLDPMSSALGSALAADWSKELQSLVSQGSTDKKAATPSNSAAYDNDISALATKILQYLDNDANYQAAFTSAMANSAITDKATRYATALQKYSDAYKKFSSDVQNLAKGFNGDLTFGQQFPTTSTGSSTTSTSTASATSKPAMPSYLAAGLDMSWEPKTKVQAAKIPPGGAGAAASKKQASSIDPRPSWTLNLGGSFYTNPNAALEETTWRGATAAGQLQWSLGSGPFVKDPNNKSQVTISLSGKYQRLQENQHQTGKKADIGLGNIKLEIPIQRRIVPALNLGRKRGGAGKGNLCPRQFRDIVRPG